MKELKIIAIAVIFTIAIMLSTAFAMPAQAEADRGEFYPKLTVVTKYERIGNTDEWIITCTDKNGNEWTFYGEEEHCHIGAMYNLLMWKLGKRIEDDEIIEVYYEGIMGSDQLMRFLYK